MAAAISGQVVRRRTFPLPTMKFPAGKQMVEVPFEVDSGLMVIPVSVNGSQPMRYVLDTGASGAVHFDDALVDSLKLKITGEVQVRGAGGGGAPSTASIAEDVTFNIGGIEFTNGHLAVRHSGLGTTSGAIGRDVFANVVVEVDWEKRVLKFDDPAKFQYSGSGVLLPLTFDEGGRPYTMAAAAVVGEKTVPVKVVVDAGASHALSLDVDSLPEITLPEGAVKTSLGRGASGEVLGHAGRISKFEFAGQTFRNVPTSFPDSSAGTFGENGRQGNLGSGILRRFKVIYDYSRKQMILESNKFVGEPFGTPLRPLATFAIAPAMLNDYVGKYGNKEISAREGTLHYQRIGGSGAVLRAIGKDKFVLNTDAQLTFVRDARNTVAEVIIDWVERDREQLKREPLDSSPKPSPKNSPAANESAFITELGSFLEKTVAEDKFSGAVLVARDGRPIFKKAYGLANKENAIANNIDTRFDLGSMNKMFTAVAIAQLVERGKLSFTDTVGKILPGYQNKNVADKVTVHHLLTHTSGMGSYFNEQFRAKLNELRTVSDYLPLFVDEPLAFEPGSKWQYSNSGFVLLGLIVEKVSGQSYFDYVKENIFKPAGMTSTDSYERDKPVSNLAIGYTKAGEDGRLDSAASRRSNSAMRPAKGSPAGGGYSTVEDLLKFSVALRDYKLLSQKSTELITTGKVEMGPAGSGRKYAYGFGEDSSSGRRIIGHNGGGPGIGANLDIFTEPGYTVIVLGNYDPPAMMPVVMKIRELLPVVRTTMQRP
jgi:CubicO group peptidase (beta-lactamase class C family)